MVGFSEERRVLKRKGTVCLFVTATFSSLSLQEVIYSTLEKLLQECLKPYLLGTQWSPRHSSNILVIYCSINAENAKVSTPTVPKGFLWHVFQVLRPKFSQLLSGVSVIESVGMLRNEDSLPLRK